MILREDLGAAVLIDKPLAALVSNNPALRRVDDKLREALEELSAGNAADAVTDAGTALQMLLEHLGYVGGPLGDQLKLARKSGWLDGVDTPMVEAVDAIVRWVAALAISAATPTMELRPIRMKLSSWFASLDSWCCASARSRRMRHITANRTPPRMG